MSAKHRFVPLPVGEKLYCTADGPRGGACYQRAVVCCDGKGDGCLVGGDAWCPKHDPRRASLAAPRKGMRG